MEISQIHSCLPASMTLVNKRVKYKMCDHFIILTMLMVNGNKVLYIALHQFYAAVLFLLFC